jgi:hypothetical protein
MKKLVVCLVVCFLAVSNARTQEITLENFDLNQVMGKVLTVKRGYSPDFFLGKRKIGKVAVLGQILGSKNNPDIDRLFRTFKTGRTVYKVAAYSGTALTLYGAVRNVMVLNKDSVSTAQKNAATTALYSGLGTVVSGVVVKLLTKQASYKAVDLFGGVVKRKLGDIIGIDLGMVPSVHGAPMMKAGLKIAL